MIKEAKLVSGVFVTEGGEVYWKGKRVPQHLRSGGYPGVSIYMDGKVRNFSVHRLVASAFCDGFDQNLCVNHKNGIKTDSRASNLEWVTLAENSRHAIDSGLHRVPTAPCNKGHRNGRAILSEQDVIRIREMFSSGVRQFEIAKEFGVNRQRVYQIVRRKQWTHLDDEITLEMPAYPAGSSDDTI